MRRFPILALLVLAGCKPGRQAAVTNDGLVASTVDGRTSVAGRGRVATGGEALAFSPDGKRLAIAAQDGAVIWPDGERLAGMGGPLAFSPDGGALAGSVGERILVWDVTSGRTRPTTIRGLPTGLRWTQDGRPFGFGGRELQMDGQASITTRRESVIDAAAMDDGEVAFIAWDALPDSPSDVLHRTIVRGRWDPKTGSVSTERAMRVPDLFGSTSSGRLDVPLRLALAPDGLAFVAAGVRVEASPANLRRMEALTDRANPTPAEQREMNARLKAARLTNAVVRIDGRGRSTTLWNAPGDGEHTVTDVEFSPDGRWLAIALPDRTVRINLKG